MVSMSNGASLNFQLLSILGYIEGGPASGYRDHYSPRWESEPYTLERRITDTSSFKLL